MDLKTPRGRAGALTGQRRPGISEAIPAKRLQILEGARRIFRARGFDGASMADIAKAAGVSKGTLYVYFESKEELFKELVLEDRRRSAEQIVPLDTQDSDPQRVLGAFGRSIVEMLVKPEHIAMARMVMAASEQFPAVGRVFYEAGPGHGIARLALYIETLANAGRLSVADPHLAAAHFLELCQGTIVKPRFFGITAAPSPEAIDQTVDAAVAVFMAAYGPRASRG